MKAPRSLTDSPSQPGPRLQLSPKPPKSELVSRKEQVSIDWPESGLLWIQVCGRWLKSQLKFCIRKYAALNPRTFKTPYTYFTSFGGYMESMQDSLPPPKALTSPPVAIRTADQGILRGCAKAGVLLQVCLQPLLTFQGALGGCCQAHGVPFSVPPPRPNSPSLSQKLTPG